MWWRRKTQAERALERSIEIAVRESTGRSIKGLPLPVYTIDPNDGFERLLAETMPLEERMAVAVQAAVERNNGNVRAASRELQISPTTAYRYLEKLKGQNSGEGEQTNE